MATNALPLVRGTDLQSVRKALYRVVDALNKGGDQTRPFKSLSTVVMSLPTANDAGVGARAIVTDATLDHPTGLGTVVQGGDANIVPVYSDGTNWIIG